MQRITKAAIASGAAALLLIGGGVTLAYWTSSGTTGIDALQSGTLNVTAAQCDGAGWKYTSAPYAGDSVEDGMVPGDSASTTCTITMTGTGDHLHVEASFGDLAVGTTSPSGQTDAAAGAITLVVSDPMVSVGGATAAASTDGLIDLSGTDGATVTATVTLTATYPYGSEAADGTVPTTAFDIVAQNDAIELSVTQVNPASTTSAP